MTVSLQINIYPQLNAPFSVTFLLPHQILQQLEFGAIVKCEMVVWLVGFCQYPNSASREVLSYFLVELIKLM